MDYYSNIDLTGNEILNAVVHPSSTNIPDPVEGQIYYDTVAKCMKIFDGQSFVPFLSDIEAGDHILVSGTGRTKTVSADLGYYCTDSWNVLFDDDVSTSTSVGDDYATQLILDSYHLVSNTIRVTYNDQEYVCQKYATIDTLDLYGAEVDTEASVDYMDWSQYPFIIVSDPINNTVTIGTENSENISVKLEEQVSVVTTSECFERSVKKLLGYAYELSNWETIHTQQLGK